MFCYQCEQTQKGTGCTAKGVCGKEAEVAVLQDLIVHGLKGLSQWAHRARLLGKTDAEIDLLTMEAAFTTVTNVNFDPDRLESVLRRLARAKDRARSLYEAAAEAAGKTPERPAGPALWEPAETREGLLEEGRAVSIPSRQKERGADQAGVEELILYGLKGLAAYADHAWILGERDPAVPAFVHEALNALSEPHGLDALLPLALRVGEVNLRVMELLDRGHTATFGHPSPTPVRVHPKKGKAILVSGHDMKDLKALLEQTEGKGINVYTHGEMLPAHGYPELRRHAHLAGNYGGAWQDQRKEFDEFPGAILMTTNCIQRPKESYQGRIFTTGLVAWPGVAHVQGPDFGPVIEAALEAPGFSDDGPDQTILVGFGHNAVLGLADKVIDAVKSGAIRRFFLVGGCDGAKPGRNYYTELVESVPKDCVVLTLACGKFRFNKLDLGNIGGIPRLLDIGQCNDAYSAIQIALALAKAFDTGVNGLPLSFVLSWYEQKAVVVLLTLLHLGIQGIRLGPSLPAFVTPAVLKVLVEKFGIAPITTPADDLHALLG
ncbi:MAG: hydroxylamine reductase [Polyangia bacterium]|nr:hydroxylamine reductase [Polyangia bacterium]